MDIRLQDLERGRIDTEEQAIAFVEMLIEEMLMWRNRCDIQVPGGGDVPVKAQQRCLWTFLTKQGNVVGALRALKLAGLLSDKGYVLLNQKAINTLIPTVTGG